MKRNNRTTCSRVYTPSKAVAFASSTPVESQQQCGSVPVVITERVYEAGCKEIWNENIIIIVVIMGQIFLFSVSPIFKNNNIFTFTQNLTSLNMLASENICQAHVTASNNCTRGFLMLPFSVLGLFLPVLVAINRIVHACSLLSPEWQKKSSWGNKKIKLNNAVAMTMKMEIFLHPSIIETEILSS